MIARLFYSILIVFLVVHSVAYASAKVKLDTPVFKAGEWVSYSMTKGVKDGAKQAFEAKYSIVGAEQYEGQDCLWHEVEFHFGKNEKTVYRVLLPTTKAVSAETMLCYLSVVANIGDAKRYIIWAPGAQPSEAEMGVLKAVNDDLIKKGKRKAFAQDEPIKSLDEMKREKPGVVINAAGKEFKCDFFAAALKSELSKHREWTYQVWRSNVIPVFGFAKLRYEKVLFGRSELIELVIKDFGFSGAKSIVPGEPIKVDMRVGKGPSAPKSN